MGSSKSTLKEDKGLQLCRERKKFVKQVLNGRCSLASSHISYIEELKIIGNALRRFFENDAELEPLALGPRAPAEKTISQLSSSGSYSLSVETAANNSQTPSTPLLSMHHSNHMKFSVFSRNVETEPVTFSFSSTTPTASETTPWDYFDLFPQIDDHFPSSDGHRNPMAEPDLEDVEEKISQCEIEEESSQVSEDEFDEPSAATLVQSFKNFNTEKETGAYGDLHGLSGNVKPEIKFGKGVMKTSFKSPELSPVRGGSSPFLPLNDVNITPTEHSQPEEGDQVVPKGFFFSVEDIELLFVKASEAGEELPRMLEANKFHFRPVYRGERGLITSALLKSCFSCREDLSETRQEPAQNTEKFLTWRRSTSLLSGSSRNLPCANSTHVSNDADNNLFDTLCMVSGSHASTLDRLYAWEKKLYDEVKAWDILKIQFDRKCKLLQQQESRGQNPDKTRAGVKYLHSRIRVAIHRIESISKKIEEIRDKELLPQLEELIEGLRKMWEQMLESHKLQFHIVSISQTPSKITDQSEAQRQLTILLCNELSFLSSAFTKWIEAQRKYVESIEKWLYKCVFLQQSSSRRNKRAKPPSLRNLGPPIYMICGAWLEMIEKLPAKGVTDSIKDLADEVTRFLIHQEKKGDLDRVSMLKEEASEDWTSARESFQMRLAGFFGQLNKFSESSVEMFAELQVVIGQAKDNYAGQGQG